MDYTCRYKYSHGARTSVTSSEVGVQDLEWSKPKAFELLVKGDSFAHGFRLKS